ncbi:MAG: hypothetical protein E7480_00800 [Ruminococcaceae bacterium]|nr:hypothetical protein [Oscillospiraceae bacterium]
MLNRLLMAKKAVCTANQNKFRSYFGSDIKAENTLEGGLRNYFIFGSTTQEQAPTLDNPAQQIGVNDFESIITSKNLLPKEEMYTKAYNASPTVVEKVEKDGRECVYFKSGVNSPVNSFTIKFKENTRYTVKTTLYYETERTSGYGVVMRVDYTDGTTKYVSPSLARYNTWNSYTFTTPQNKTVKRIYYSYNVSIPTYMDMNSCAIYEGVYTNDTIPEFTEGKIPYITNIDLAKIGLSGITALHGIKLPQESQLVPSYTDNNNNRYIADYIAKLDQSVSLVRNIGMTTYTESLLENRPPQFENLSQYNNEESCVCYLVSNNQCIAGGANTVITNYFSYTPVFDSTQTQTGIYPLDEPYGLNRDYIRLRYDLGIISSTDTNLQKQQKFQQWLIEKAQQGNPLTVMYAAKNAYSIDITDSQLGQELAKIDVFPNYTNIYNTNKLWQFALIKVKE